MGWLDNWNKDESIALPSPRELPNHLDLRDAAIVCASATPRLMTYAVVLQDEICKRTKRHWTIVPHGDVGPLPEPCVVLNVDPNSAIPTPEGYTLVVVDATVRVTGGSDRGLLFGVGRLLREMTLDYHESYTAALASVCGITLGLHIVSAPMYALRQHQVAYRPKTNSYDAFTVAQMQQEITDLALFGTNGIEVIPPALDDAAQSPHFTVPWLQMLTATSRWCDNLDLNVSIWYPAFFRSYDGDGATAARAHWDSVFAALPRLDVLFIPGGDPGGRPAANFFPIAEVHAEHYRRHFPRGEVWVSSQYGLGMSHDLGLPPWDPVAREAEFFAQLHEPHVSGWLTGVVYGPWSCCPLAEFREHVPAELPVRNYPDLCHSLSCEFPVDRWDLCFALAQHREPINPRPTTFGRIIAAQAPYTIGCGCYSEGVSDDVNKYVWTALHWGPDCKGPLCDASPEQQLDAVLMQYAAFLALVPRAAVLVMQGIYGLERNWDTGGDLLGNTVVLETLAVFRRAEAVLAPRHHKSWRLQMLLWRAYYDAFLYRRLQQERAAEARARDLLTGGLTPPLLDAALKVLAPGDPADGCGAAADTCGDAAKAEVVHLYARLTALAGMLFVLCGLQLTTDYGGQHCQRGACFDLAWVPLGDVEYFRREVSVARATGDTAALAAALAHPGLPGRTVLWYGSFGEGRVTGNVPLWRVLPPHRPLSLGEDPTYFARYLTDYMDSSNEGLLGRMRAGGTRHSAKTWVVPIWPRAAVAAALRFPLPEVGYRGGPLHVRFTYVGSAEVVQGGDWEELDRQLLPTRLMANGVEVHGLLPPPKSTETMEFTIPEAALTTDCAELVLSFEVADPAAVMFCRTPFPVAELWLITP